MVFLQLLQYCNVVYTQNAPTRRGVLSRGDGEVAALTRRRDSGFSVWWPILTPCTRIFLEKPLVTQFNKDAFAFIRKQYLSTVSKKDTGYEPPTIAELGYNDLGLCDTSDITLYIHCHQLLPHKARVFLPCLVRQI